MVLAAFAAVFTPITIFLIFGGVVLGIIFGAIPGMSGTMAVALCLPITFGLSPVEGISLLLGLYIGGISGGLISAILINIPGTPSSIATCFDGSPMARHGEAGKALGIGILYSFLGGLVSFVALIFLSPPIAKFSLRFSPYEYTAVMLFSLTLIASLSEGSLIKGLLSGALGISLAVFGVSPVDSFKRFTFGMYQMELGFGLLSVLIGFYAISEIFEIAGNKYKSVDAKVMDFKIKGLGISMKEFIQQLGNFFRSSLIGIGIGILPGIGGGTSNILAYVAAKSQSKYPEKFGTGIIDGLIASEAANNATIGGALIPLLTLGIPGDTVTAVILGGLMIHGITPGPMLFTTNGDLIYAIFVALMFANIIMLIVEFFGIRLFVRILQIPKNILLPVIVCLCVVGAFATNNQVFDVYTMALFGFVGYGLVKIKMPLPPIILGFILAPIIETNLRRGLMLSGGSITPFVTKPIAAVFLLAAVVSVALAATKEKRRRRKAAARQSGK
jgi:putative tricarboxylic transport membrane protein